MPQGEPQRRELSAPPGCISHTPNEAPASPLGFELGAPGSGAACLCVCGRRAREVGWGPGGHPLLVLTTSDCIPPEDSAIGGSHLPLSSRQREMVGLHPGPGSPPRRGAAASTDQGEIAALVGHQGGCVGITNGPSCQVRTLHPQTHFTARQAAHTGLLGQTPRVAGKAPPPLPQGRAQRAPHRPR